MIFSTNFLRVLEIGSQQITSSSGVIYMSNDKPMPDIVPRTPAGERCTPRQRAMVHAYIDCNSPTYSNKAASARAAGYREGGNPTAVGRKVLGNTNVRSYMREIMDAAGLGDDVRAMELARIARGDATRSIRSTTTYRDGSTVETVTDRPVTPAEQIRAIETANKMLGLYDRNRATADAMSTELRAQIKRYRSLLDTNNGATCPGRDTDSDNSHT